QYRPRPLPVKAVMNVAAALILGFGVFTAFGIFTEQTSSEAMAQRTVGIFEQRVELRSLQLEKTREARAALNAAKLKTERLIAANELIQDRDAGFSETVATIVGIAPSDVKIKTVDDDGRVVAVEAEAGDYPTLLAYIRLLEDVPQFVHVQVLKLGETSSGGADGGYGMEPSELNGGPAEVATRVAMSVKITRVKIDNSQLLSDEELVAIPGSN
ncbi:MAG: hypothetical protein V3T49_02870, partial [Dehalococcoidia bacterium]